MEALRKIETAFDFCHSVAPHITFVSAPDFSISSNHERFCFGLGVGGILHWTNSDSINTPFIPLQIMPNCCGVLCVFLGQKLDYQKLKSQVLAFNKTFHELEGLRIILDIGRKNHFLNIYQDDSGDFYALLHTSLPEVKSDNNISHGIYYNQSKHLQSKMLTLDTKLGVIHYLKDQEALDYYDTYKYYDQLSKKKRVYICDHLFDSYEIISNENHLTLQQPNMVLLGAYNPLPNNPFDNFLIPITTKPHGRAYLVQLGKKESFCHFETHVVPHGTGNRMCQFDEIHFENGRNTLSMRTRDIHTIYDLSNLPLDGYNDEDTILDPRLNSYYRVSKILVPKYEFKTS